jgi:hypothetical protein
VDKEYSITIDGEAVTFEFKDSLIHAEGGAVGNIDAIITTKPPLPQNLLLDELHIKVPGTDEYLYIYGFGVVENSLKATFNSSGHVDVNKLPESVEVYWGGNGEQYIGEMCCQLYSETIEHDLADELEETVDEPEALNENDAIGSNKTNEEEKKDKKLASEEEATENKKPLAVVISIILILMVFFIIYLVTN